MFSLPVHNTSLLTLLRHYGVMFESCTIFLAFFAPKNVLRGWNAISELPTSSSLKQNKVGFCLDGPFKFLCALDALSFMRGDLV